MNLFIIGDSEPFRERLVALIHEIPGIRIAGFANSARIAVEIAEKLRPDVITLDLRLLSDCGLDVLTQLKQMDPSIVVIVLTDWDNEEMRSLCKQKGADHFLIEFDEIDSLEMILRELQQSRAG